jgi:pyridoxal phosphate enzyme (YggS family)
MTDPSEGQVDNEALRMRYERVRSNIPPHVTLVAVSKKRSVAEIQALYDLGHRHFGENYPQELREKQPLLPADIHWHFIGNLQRNKVKYLAPFVHLVHAVDGPELLDELEKRAAAAGRIIGVLLQLHIALEETKHGMDEPELRRLLASWDKARWPHIQLRGLMGMATFTEDETRVRKEFAALASLHRTLMAEGLVDRDRFTELSMGMSGDVALALAEGSTLVRIGTAIFGDRA